MAYVIVTKLAVAKPQRNKQRKAAELRCCTGIWLWAFFLVSPPPDTGSGRWALSVEDIGPRYLDQVSVRHAFDQTDCGPGQR